MQPKPETTSGRVSTRGSGAHKSQKYHNTTAFKHNKNSKKTRQILATPITGLCTRCMDIVAWRKQFRKYKPLTTPKKCVACEKKAIKEAYHILCDPCAQSKKVCAKCQLPKDILPATSKTTEELHKEKQEHDRRLAALSERQRRTYLRKLERGDDVLLPEVQDSDDDDFDDESDAEESGSEDNTDE